MINHYEIVTYILNIFKCNKNIVSVLFIFLSNIFFLNLTKTYYKILVLIYNAFLYDY